MCSESQLNASHHADDQQRRIEMHDKCRDDLLKRLLSNNENYDRTIISLSSAGLAISLTAVNLVIPFSAARNLWLIQVSWVLFGCTVLCALLAYVIGNKAINRQLEIAEDYYIKKETDEEKLYNKYSSYNDKINAAAGITFALAISLVIAFVIFNLNGVKDMSDKKVKSQTFQDSASIPRMQSVNNEVPLTKSASIPRMQSVPSSGTSSGSTSKPSSAFSEKDSK